MAQGKRTNHVALRIKPGFEQRTEPPLLEFFRSDDVAVYEVSFTPDAGFGGLIQLEALDLPGAAVLSWSVNPAPVNEVVKLAIETANIPVGYYPFRIVGTPIPLPEALP